MASDAELLKAYLSDRDVRCPGCRYNLRGLAVQFCPECNATFMLEMTHEACNQSAFAVAISGLMSGMVVCICGIVPFLWVLWVSPSTSQPVVPAGVCLALSLAALVIVWKARRLFAAHRAKLCWAFAAACWVPCPVFAWIALGPFSMFRQAMLLTGNGWL